MSNSEIKSREKDFCKVGHQNDLIIRTLLKQELINNNTKTVLDVDSDEYCREIDVDLILINKYGNTTTSEVKADNFPALRDNKKYIFLELVSNDKKGTEGCILTSKSKYFIFYFIVYDVYLIINSQKLREFIKNNKDKYKVKISNTWSPDNREIWYHSSGIIVPVSDLVTDEVGGILKKSKLKYEDVKQQLIDDKKIS